MKNQDTPGIGFPLHLSLPPSRSLSLSLSLSLWFAGTSVPHFWLRSFCFIRYRSTRKRSQSARKGRYERETPHPENVRYIVTIFLTTLQRFESASIYITSDSSSRWLRKNLENIAPSPPPSCSFFRTCTILSNIFLHEQSTATTITESF